MNAIAKVTALDFEGSAVRVVDRAGEPWWVGKDVCDCLGIANPRDALTRLDDDERDYVGIADAIGRDRETTVINEPGIFRLILTSRVPAAERFKRWLCHEVLPALRKTGRYEVGVEAPPAPVLDPADVRARCRIVNTARLIYGPIHAAEVYERLGLPVPDDVRPRPVSATLPGLDDEAGAALDGDACLARLLAGDLGKYQHLGTTVGLAIVEAAESGARRDWLAARGILVNPPGHPGYVAIDDRHPFLLRAVAGTIWAVDWTLALATLPGAMPDVRLSMAGRKRRAVLVPIATVTAAVKDGTGR